MNIALSRQNSKPKPSSSDQQQPTAIRIQKNRNRKKNQKKEIKNKKGTHLTISGVCTTIRPEKSGT
jgi:hypothetical protein